MRASFEPGQSVKYGGSPSVGWVAEVDDGRLKVGPAREHRRPVGVLQRRRDGVRHRRPDRHAKEQIMAGCGRLADTAIADVFHLAPDRLCMPLIQHGQACIISGRDTDWTLLEGVPPAIPGFLGWDPELGPSQLGRARRRVPPAGVARDPGMNERASAIIVKRSSRFLKHHDGAIR
jgi:hypothetical protein